jgi:FMN phosphatase YigB (HAD superfamily)
MITTILFDLDETLVSWRPRYLDGLFYWLSVHTKELLLENARQIEYSIHNYWTRNPTVHLLVEDRTRWKEYYEDFIYPVCKKNGIEISLDQVLLALDDFTATYAPTHVLFDDVITELTYLQSQNYKLGVLTNRDNHAQTHAELEKFGIRDFFAGVYVSGSLGFWKPDPKIFLHAVHALGEKVENTIYVGDNYFVDIRGAQQAGMKAVLLDRKNIYRDETCIIIQELAELREKILTIL